MAKLINQRDVDINKYDLESEWLNQPSLYAKYASLAADARRDHDESKSHLDLVTAELDQSIRSDPDSYGLVKATESSISSAIKTQKSYREANQEVIDAKHHLDICLAVVSALDHKKSALQKLVDLHLSDYHSKPKASEVSKDKMEEVEQKSVRRKGRRERQTTDD